MKDTDFHVATWTDKEPYLALVFQKGDGYAGPLYEAWSVFISVLGFSVDIGRVVRKEEPVIHPPRSWGFDWRKGGLARYKGFEG